MRIQWNGPGGMLRRVEPYAWRRGEVQDVAEPQVAATLLTEPGGAFSIAADEPLLAIVGSDEIASSLLLSGVGDLATLAALSEDEIASVAAQVGMAEPVLRAAAEAARESLAESPAGEKKRAKRASSGGNE